MPGFEVIGQEEKDAVCDVFERSNGVLYRYGFDDRRNHIYRVSEFENEMSREVGSKYCTAMNSGTAALKSALLAMGVGRGDNVITQNHTFVATVEAILENGAHPVIAEVDKTLNMDCDNLYDLMNKYQAEVIIPVHMAGVPCNMTRVMRIARIFGALVLEDSCQGLGAKYDGKYLGTIGDAGCYSFDFGKVITTGEGGAVVTDYEGIYRLIRAYSDHGHDQNPDVPRGEDTRSSWGFNYKMTELQGAIGLAQLKKMDYIIDRQRKNKAYLKNQIAELGVEFREIPKGSEEAGDTLIFFMESREKASKVAKELAKEGVGTKNLPDAIDWHFAGTWKHIKEIADKEFPQSDDLLRRAIAIPIMVKSTDAELDTIVLKVMKAVEGC